MIHAPFSLSFSRFHTNITSGFILFMNYLGDNPLIGLAIVMGSFCDAIFVSLLTFC